MTGPTTPSAEDGSPPPAAAMAPLRLILDGAATIACCQDLHARLLSALRGGRDVVVDCAALEDADLCLVQALLAAHRTARANGQRLWLARPTGDVLPDLLRRAGLGGQGGDDAEAAFWKGETP
ncbi:hypothetical protein GALL_226380 [mine drainage metagenome]|uniref:STAS domain-containing protein n=1 Tax=mine drainage metagenome TaxID=410659 RepID=A0A1J5RIT9_9ZZZZ